MSIYDEIKTMMSRIALKYLGAPAGHYRPQDDAPGDTVLRHLYADYRKFYGERIVLIRYIQRLEKMYKEAQGGLLEITLYKRDNITKKRLLQELTIITYNMTKAHLDAQGLLRDLEAKEQNCD